MNYREKIRKAIECPQFGNEHYGEWGALTLEQRKYIKRLLDELDSADNYLKKVYLENEKLKQNAENNNKVVDKITYTIKPSFTTRKLKQLQKENKQLKIQISAREEVCNRLESNWNKLKEDLIKIRQLTFTKYNKNEWENCLSFNDDILPLIEKMKELEQGGDSNGQ